MNRESTESTTPGHPLRSSQRGYRGSAPVIDSEIDNARRFR